MEQTDEIVLFGRRPVDHFEFGRRIYQAKFKTKVGKDREDTHVATDCNDACVHCDGLCFY